jgi:putative ABC transport system permease protein
MRIADLMSETFLSLGSNRARSFLTILGIVVGITSVIVMVSIGSGTKASIEESIQSVGSNLLMVSPTGGGPSGGTMSVDDADSIRTDVPGIAAVAPAASGQYTVVAGANNADVAITGTTADYPQVRSVETSYGSWFAEADVADSSRVAVLGAQTAEDLFGEGSNPLGQRIRIGSTPFTVIGVAASKGSSGMSNSDEAVYVPIRTLQRYLTGSDDVSTIFVEAATQEGMDAAKTAIESLLLSRHDIANADEADFQVLSQSDLAETASSIATTLTLLLGSIAGISLVVGGIGIMNMMLTTVTERIREIGLRKAIGATRSDITSQFLAEAVALTVVGGVIGIALGWGLSAAIAAFSPLNTTVTAGSVLLAVGVATGIGLVFGYYPARRAAKLDPIEALRYQ